MDISQLTKSPRCLKPYVLAAADCSESNERQYVVSCPCGSGTWKLEGYHWAENTEFGKGPDFDLQAARFIITQRRQSGNEKVHFVGPISTVCQSCADVWSLFDVRTHGLAAETNSVCTHVVGHGVRETFHCKCGESEFDHLTAAFNYDQESLAEWSEIPLLLDPKRLQDYFDCFVLSGRCIGCGETTLITAFEEMGT